MSFNSQDDRAHLFLVRIRQGDKREFLQPENKVWCGRVQRVVTGEAYEFRSWAELISCLRAMLDAPQADNSTNRNSAGGDEK